MRPRGRERLSTPPPFPSVLQIRVCDRDDDCGHELVRKAAGGTLHVPMHRDLGWELRVQDSADNCWNQARDRREDGSRSIEARCDIPGTHRITLEQTGHRPPRYRGTAARSVPRLRAICGVRPNSAAMVSPPITRPYDRRSREKGRSRYEDLVTIRIEIIHTLR